MERARNGDAGRECRRVFLGRVRRSRGADKPGGINNQKNHQENRWSVKRFSQAPPFASHKADMALKIAPPGNRPKFCQGAAPPCLFAFPMAIA